MDILELTKKLIEFKSTREYPVELKRIVDFVDEFLGEGFIKKRFVSNDKHSIVVSFTPDRHQKIMFVGHLDVVEADEVQFHPVVEGDKLFGRGALDMKGPDAVMIKLFKDLKGTNLPISLMLTTDEEVGSRDGVEFLLKKQDYSAEFAIIPDGGENFSIITKSKGVAHFHIEALGASTHGSRPWEGINAIDKLIDFYKELKKNFPEEPCGDLQHWHNTINLGLLRGGKAPNIVPDWAEMEIDIRFIEPWTVAKMHAFVLEKAGEKVNVELRSYGEVVSTPEDHPMVQKFKESLEEVLGRKAEFRIEHGATDGRFFAEMGIPSIVTYPVGGNIHAKDEWVSIKSLYQLYEIFKVFLEKAL